MPDTYTTNTRAAHFVEEIGVATRSPADGRATAPVAVDPSDGFVVVSRFKLQRPAVPPYQYDYSYAHYASLSDADEHRRDLESGEYEGWEAVTILPALKGVPLGGKRIV